MDAKGSGPVISGSLNRISDVWDAEVEARGEGDAAWSWIKESVHWHVIKAAEAELDRIGRNGDPDELNVACSNWIGAWVQAIREFSQSTRGNCQKSKSQMAFGF